MTKLVTKVAQIFGDFFGYFENVTFKITTTMATFWATFDIHWATFHFIFWSHCSEAARQCFHLQPMPLKTFGNCRQMMTRHVRHPKIDGNCKWRISVTYYPDIRIVIIGKFFLLYSSYTNICQFYHQSSNVDFQNFKIL